MDAILQEQHPSDILPSGGPPSTGSGKTEISVIARPLGTIRGRGKFAANDLWRRPSFQPPRRSILGRRFRTIFRHARLIVHCLLSHREDEQIAPGMQERISSRLQAAVQSKNARKQGP
jgi:hypothetical protein